MLTISEKLEFYLLCALLFVLPTVETPKALALVLFVAVWIGRRVSLSGWRRFRPDLIEVTLLAMLAAGVASTAANWPFPNGTKGVVDTLRNVAVFWCIYRAGYSEAQYRTLAIAATLGLVLGLVVGVVEVTVGTRSQLELHSAGVLTQSAIYVAVVLIMALGVVLTRWLPRGKHAMGHQAIPLWLAAIVAMAIALVVMGSRGALLATGFTVFLIVVLVNRARLWMVAAAAAILVALSVFVLIKSDSGGSLVASAKARYASEHLAGSDLERRENWRIALAHIRQADAPWLGIGPRNYHSIDHSRFTFDPPLQLKANRLNHAHNLFLTKLVEEGVLGLGAFVLFFGLAVRALAASWIRGSWYDWKWVAALGALTVPVIAGSFNTPFYQEHAMLAMALMAIYLGARRGMAGAAAPKARPASG